MATAEVLSINQPFGAASPDACMIYTEDLWKTYDMGSEQQVHALRGVNLRIQRNEYVAIMGPSGSGKSTLMNLIGCLDSPSKGQYWLNNQQVSELDDDELARIRNKEIGFVFQTFNLLARATALHNVELPLIYAGIPAEQRVERAKEALSAVGMESRMMHKPNSGINDSQGKTIYDFLAYDQENRKDKNPSAFFKSLSDEEIEKLKAQQH